MSTPKILGLLHSSSAYDDEELSFQSIDYIRGLPIRLAPKIDNDRGVVTRRTFYREATISETTGMEVFDDPIVMENYEYVRDSDNFALYRDCIITWFNEDGTENPATKIRRKTYSPVARVQESARRRNNVIDNLKITLIGMVAQTEQVVVQEAITLAQALFVEQQSNIVTYIEAGTDFLLNYVISATNYPWMDNAINAEGVTIRDYIISQLT